MPQLQKRYVTGNLKETDLLLAKGGKAVACIILPDMAKEKEQAAAEDLKTHLDAITGGDFAIKKESEADLTTGNFILVGETLQTKALGIGPFTTYPGGEQTVLQRIGNYLILCGNDTGNFKGTQFAVTAFLLEAGCGFYGNEEIWNVIPSLPDLGVEEGLCAVHTPRFFSRQISNVGKLGERWFLGGEEMITGHGLPWFAPKSAYETHPEFFALVNGERDPNRFEYWQYCYSNDQLAQTVAKNIGEYFDKTPNMVSFPLPANDGWDKNWCECDACRKLENKSDAILTLINKVAKILQKTHPDRFISILSYHSTFFPPNMEVEPNVEVMFCTETGMFLPLDEGHLIPTGPNPITHVTYTQSWKDNFYEYIQKGKVAHPTIWCWYCIGTDFADWIEVPWVQGNVITRNLKLWEDAGVTRVFFDGSGPEKIPVRWPLYYAAAMGMWDGKRDAESVLYEACHRLFGRAAEGMFRYYMALAKTAAACQSSDAITWLPPAVYKVYGEYDAIQQAVDEVLPLLDQLNAKEKERVENQLGYWAKTKTLLSETKENI